MWLNPYIKPIKYLIYRLPFALFTALLIWNCGAPVAVEQLDNLNGYWEIVKVVVPNEPEKAYGLSGTIDYFEIVGNRGYRKKVQPQLNGKYATSDDAITFDVVPKDEGIYLRYEGGAGAWTEKLQALGQNKLVLVGESGIMYHYERYKLIGAE